MACRCELKKTDSIFIFYEQARALKESSFQHCFFSEQALLALTWHVQFAAGLPSGSLTFCLARWAWLDLVGLS
jgi:hypothetical protein